MSELPLCECGERVTKPGNRFRSGHNKGNLGKSKPKPEPQLCKCGCGEYALSGNRFISGHQNKNKSFSDPHKLALSESHIGIPLSDFHKLAIAKANLKDKKPLASGLKIKIDGMIKNKECSNYLGIVIAEQMLSKIFKNIQIMPYSNHGFDIICNHNKKIDIKSSATGYKGYWSFAINKNQVADYFLCIAFDNRDDLNPVHLWLIPGNVINHLILAQISKSTLEKWSKYEQPLDKVIVCCDQMKQLKEMI